GWEIERDRERQIGIPSRIEERPNSAIERKLDLVELIGRKTEELLLSNERIIKTERRRAHIELHRAPPAGVRLGRGHPKIERDLLADGRQTGHRNAGHHSVAIRSHLKRSVAL